MTPLAALEQALRAAAGPRVGVGVTDPGAPQPPLWPEETPATRRMVPARRHEFAAGRAAARAALSDIGAAPGAVPMGEDRAPRWPAGLTGTISHAPQAAVALVARGSDRTGLGVDVEPAADLPGDLWPEILTPAETAWLQRQPAARRAIQARAIFSAKEALHKLLHPLTGRTLSFTDVTMTLDPAGTGLRVRLPIAAPPLPPVLTGHLFEACGLLVTLFAPCPARPPSRTHGILPSQPCDPASCS